MNSCCVRSLQYFGYGNAAKNSDKFQIFALCAGYIHNSIQSFRCLATVWKCYHISNELIWKVFSKETSKDILKNNFEIKFLNSLNFLASLVWKKYITYKVSIHYLNKNNESFVMIFTKLQIILCCYLVSICRLFLNED